ncbi:MAG TPA: ATP-binding protein [Nitrospiraceae bacterium]|nr:ATP-binding protein [Nitrospiraceae bacterium]
MVVTPSAEQTKVSQETHLQRTLTSVLNDLPVDAALAAIFHREKGPLVAQVYRGFTPRDVQAIIRTLSVPETSFPQPSSPEEPDGSRTIRLRLITPGAKSLLAAPLRYRQRTYGYLVIGRKESVSFAKKEKSLIETASEEITKALEREVLFDNSVVLSRPLVAQEPLTAPAGADLLAASPSRATPEMQEQVGAVLGEIAPLLPYDRAWVCCYDPLVGSVEVIAIAGDQKGEHKKDLRPGQRLALDASAAGWAVRHRKPRVDHDLASTQGRFVDHKHLYKDRFRSSLVVPFFVRGQVGGTLTLASKESAVYSVADACVLEPAMLKLIEIFQHPPASQLAKPQEAASGDGQIAAPAAPAPSEPMIRKQERQAAIGEFSAFLATEIREPLASIRAQLEEVTSEGVLDFDPQTRVENAMRDLIRIEAILNEILDFAKPLELNRRLCRVPEIIENALTVVATELEVTRIHVTKDYASHVSPVRCDEAKMQQVFLSIFKNALEAMTPGGHLEIQVANQRAGRHQEVQILIKNDGAPIPTEHVGKVFEPFFTTKRSGTGLGLATVKKIVEEHQGHISIASGPGQGTTVIIRLPAAGRTGAYRHRGRGRRPSRRAH